MLLVGIDLGTYLCRFILVKYTNKSLNVAKYQTYIVNFGNVHSGNIISDRVETRIIKAFDSIAKHVKKGHVIRCVATAALRISVNSEELVAKIFQKHQIKVEIINPEHEIYLSALACLYNNSYEDAVIVDIGSGSIELAYVKHLHGKVEMQKFVSLNLGLLNNLSSKEQRSFALDQLKTFKQNLNCSNVIVSKCNVLKIVNDYMKNFTNILYVADMKHALDKFCVMKNSELMAIQSAEKKCKLIKLGLPWVYKIFETMGFQQIRLSEFGLKEGIILDMINLHEEKR